jgi:hypothetical protein
MPLSAPRVLSRGLRSFVAVASVALWMGCAIVSVLPDRTTARVAPRFDREHFPFAVGEVVFSHDAHATTDCSTCHFDSVVDPEAEAPDATSPSPDAVATAETPSPISAPHVLLPAMAVCFECHDGESLSRDCETCHLENRKERKPQFHDAGWQRHHRDLAESESYKCALCHIEKDCDDCHSTMRPASHTPRFARSEHGRRATHDRSECAVCHDQDYCENCHSQPPPDHTPAFIGDPTTGRAGHKQAAAIRGRACFVCHSFEDVCARCHE